MVIIFSKLVNTEIEYIRRFSEDTAKDMYRKCGFDKVGEKTELFFDIKNLKY